MHMDIFEQNIWQYLKTDFSDLNQQINMFHVKT